MCKDWHSLFERPHTTKSPTRSRCDLSGLLRFDRMNGVAFGQWSPVAQLAERLTVNQDVAGSSPAGGAGPSSHDEGFRK